MGDETRGYQMGGLEARVALLTEQQTAMNGKLDRLLEKGDGTSQQLAVHDIRLTRVEALFPIVDELKTRQIKLWMMMTGSGGVGAGLALLIRWISSTSG